MYSVIFSNLYHTAVNFLLGKVGEPHIKSYVNHVSREANSRAALHAIVPDIHAHNFPVGRQTVDDYGSNRTAEAFFEVKTFTAYRTRYDHKSTRLPPGERRAKLIGQEYAGKFKTLDRMFASDVVGDGTNNVVGPFETSQGRFYRGQVTPLCAGGFGEINKDFEKLLKVLTREAVSGTVGLSISPLANNERKGSAYPIMLQQFRRAIGVAIACGNARHKVGCLHYVRSTADEAAHTCKRSHSAHRWRANQNGRATWFSEHVPAGYTTFE